MTREELAEAIKPLKAEVQTTILENYDGIVVGYNQLQDAYNKLIRAEKFDKMNELLERHFKGTQQVSDKDALLNDIMKTASWLL